MELVVPAAGKFQSSSTSGMRRRCHRGDTLGAVADSSGDDHSCGVGCRQGELLAHGLWGGNLTSFSSIPVWDAKDALTIRAGWKFSGGTLLCWKMLILQDWSISQEHVGSIGGFNGKQAGSLCSWLHASRGFPGSLLPRQRLLQLPDTLTRPPPQQGDGCGWETQSRGH